MGGTCVVADVCDVAGVGERVACEFCDDTEGCAGDFSGVRSSCVSCALAVRNRGRKLRSLVFGLRGDGPRISSSALGIESSDAWGAEKMRRFACGLCAKSAERVCDSVRCNPGRGGVRTSSPRNRLRALVRGVKAAKTGGGCDLDGVRCWGTGKDAGSSSLMSESYGVSCTTLDGNDGDLVYDGVGFCGDRKGLSEEVMGIVFWRFCGVVGGARIEVSAGAALDDALDDGRAVVVAADSARQVS